VYLEHEPLAKYTAWRIGGPARYLWNAVSPEELREALRWGAERQLPALLLGGGSNVLVPDAGWPGLVVRYRAQELRVEEAGAEGRAWIAAGAPMAGTARRLARQGWAGLEWAEGLPGTIGGAVFGNAGCYGGDIASSLTRAWLLVSEEIEEWPVERFGYGYRTSTLKAERAKPPIDTHAHRSQEEDIRVHLRSSLVTPIVVAAEFVMRRADPVELARQMERTAETRKSKTPWGSSCGSVFKNPPGDSAGRLIEAAGLKGTRSGAAEIAQKHANYIVNLGGASSDDVLRLIDIARERVLGAFGVELELEVQVIG
jgi:UDP-N-acetylmuramate dehydrogenase